MPAVVVIKFLGGEIAGQIGQSGQDLHVDAEFPSIRQALEALLEPLRARPLTCWTGRQEPGQRITLARAVRPGESSYLAALAETITRDRWELAGQRIRAYVEERDGLGQKRRRG